jgi:hypothetical protein
MPIISLQLIAVTLIDCEIELPDHAIWGTLGVTALQTIVAFQRNTSLAVQ